MGTCPLWKGVQQNKQRTSYKVAYFQIAIQIWIARDLFGLSLRLEWGRPRSNKPKQEEPAQRKPAAPTPPVVQAPITAPVPQAHPSILILLLQPQTITVAPPPDQELIVLINTLAGFVATDGLAFEVLSILLLFNVYSAPNHEKRREKSKVPVFVPTWIPSKQLLSMENLFTVARR